VDRGQYVLAVVPASRRLDLRRVREALEDPGPWLATEAESVRAWTAGLFRDEPLAVLPLTRQDGRARQDPIPSAT
jgi:hypothetical protein